MLKTLLFFTAMLLSLLGSWSYAQVVKDFSGQSTRSGLINSPNKDLALYNNPHGIDISPDGIIYIADRFNHVIRKIDTNGVVSTIAGNGTIGDVDGPALNAQFFEPWDVCAGNNGEVYISDAKNNKIKVLEPNGQVTTLAGTGNAGFADNPNPLASTFFWPAGLEYDHETGDLFVAGHLSHLIRKISSTKNVTTFAGIKTNFPNNFGSVDGPALQAQFYRPYGIHLGPNKELYVADEWNDQIRVIKNGVVSTIGGQPDTPGYKEGGADSSLFNFPWDVTTDINGYVYVLDGDNHVIRKINPESNTTEFFAGGVSTTGATNGELKEARFNGATGIEYYSGSLYISDAFNHVIRVIDLLEKITLSTLEDNYCLGDTATVLASPQYYDRYYWYKGEEFITSTTEPSLNHVLTDTKGISVQGERTGTGLSLSDTLILASDVSETSINVTPLSTFCKGDSVLLSTPFDSVLWSTGKRAKTIVVRDDGVYSFEHTENNCLVSSGDTVINFLSLPLVTVSPKERIIEEGDSVLVTASGADSFMWSTGQETAQVYLKKEASYFVTGVSTGSSCRSQEIEVSIEVIPVQDTTGLEVPFFPDAFSPNDDGDNDSYEILGIRLVPENKFSVYNRWGQLLYDKDNYLNDWRGENNNNQEMIEGTYFYVFIDKDTNKKYNGYVVLKR